MGLRQSKDELLYQQVTNGNIEGIKALRTEGAYLEWTDREGKTPLMVACSTSELYNVAKTLIELGANINSCSAGHVGGTPLHHAARSGLEHTVKLLLSHGANALVMNDDCQTPIDIARFKGHSGVVRAIEGHLCFFSGWLRELHGPGFLDLLAPQLLSRRVWVVVMPCGSRRSRKPLKLEFAIYGSIQDAQPRTIIPLWKSNIEEPNFNQTDPVATISVVSKIRRRWKRRRGIKSSQEARRGRIKLGPMHENEKHQLQQFCNACKGIRQVLPLPPHSQFPVPTAPANAQQMEPYAVRSVLDTCSNKLNFTAGASTSHMPNGSKCEVEETIPSGSSALPLRSHNSVPSVVNTVPDNRSPASVPSAPPATADDGPVHYPSIDTTSIGSSSVASETSSSSGEVREDRAGSSCTICLDAPVEGACVPCGHMAGCMSCLNEINAKKWGCPVCRSPIVQVMRIYAV